MINNEKKLVLMDVDGTLVNGQSQRLLVSFLYEKNLISFLRYITILSWYILYKIGFVKDVKLVASYAFAYLKDKKVSQFENIFSDFFESVLIPRIYKDSFELIRELKTRGAYIVLVSTAIEPIVMRVKDYVGADEYIATILEKRNGLYTGRIEGSIVYGQEKRVAVTNYLKNRKFDLSKAAAFADHASDVQILSSVGFPVVVNPSSELERCAKKNHWPMIYFNNNESLQYFKSHSLPQWNSLQSSNIQN